MRELTRQARFSRGVAAGLGALILGYLTLAAPRLGAQAVTPVIMDGVKPQEHVDAAKKRVLEALELLQSSLTVSRVGIVGGVRKDLPELLAELNAASQYLDQHPQAASLPPVASSTYKSIVEQVAATKKIAQDELPTQFRVLNLFKAAADEIHLASGGAWDGHREEIFIDLDQAISNMVSAIHIYRVDNTTRAGRRSSGIRTAPPASEHFQSLSSTQVRGILNVKGDAGSGTGFFAKINGSQVIVTSLHLLGNSGNVTVTNLQGTVIPWSGLTAATAGDIALLRVPKPPSTLPALAVAEDVYLAAKIDDKITVIGIRPGTGEVAPLASQIKGIGTTRIRFDGALQPGNSGSPVVDSTSGEIIGVAAFSEIMTVDFPSNTSLAAPSKMSGNTTMAGVSRTAHWFGYRLDTVADWEPIDPATWRTQMKQVNDFREISLALLALLRGDLTEAQKNTFVHGAVEHLMADLQRARATANPADAASASDEVVRNFLRQTSLFAGSALKEFSEAKYYGFFLSSPQWATNVPDQFLLREHLAKAFADLEPNHQVFLARLSP